MRTLQTLFLGSFLLTELQHFWTFQQRFEDKN